MSNLEELYLTEFSITKETTLEELYEKYVDAFHYDLSDEGFFDGDEKEIERNQEALKDILKAEFEIEKDNILDKKEEYIKDLINEWHKKEYGLNQDEFDITKENIKINFNAQENENLIKIEKSGSAGQTEHITYQLSDNKMSIVSEYEFYEFSYPMQKNITHFTTKDNTVFYEYEKHNCLYASTTAEVYKLELQENGLPSTNKPNLVDLTSIKAEDKVELSKFLKSIMPKKKKQKSSTQSKNNNI